MPLPTRITLPPSGRPVGGLLSAARPIGGDWTRGVVFSSGECLQPINVGPCSGDEAETKGQQDLSAPAEFQAFNVVQAVQCSTLGRSEVDVLAGQALDVTREFGVARELLAAGATGNPSLADALVMAAAADPVTALGCLEARANAHLAGRMAFIHVSPAVGTHLLANAAIFKEGRRWYTASGNTVVISPGYDGREPGGDSPGAGEPLFMYATGEVYAEVGSGDQRQILQSVERTQNTAQAWAEDVALVIFDPCFNVAIDSGINSCEVVS